MERITKSPLPAPFSSEALVSEKPTAVLYITPLAGRPNPCSRAEKRLEAVLSRYEWATGRAWNQTWSTSILHNPIRVDLIWHEPRCVIEIDGPDHLDPTKYAADRVRDRILQLEGFAVLRFTNQEVLDDAERVALQIGRFLTQATAE
jgi:very-short-patch-repair endonuclease